MGSSSVVCARSCDARPNPRGTVCLKLGVVTAKIKETFCTSRRKIGHEALCLLLDATCQHFKHFEPLCISVLFVFWVWAFLLFLVLLCRKVCDGPDGSARDIKSAHQEHHALALRETWFCA